MENIHTGVTHVCMMLPNSGVYTRIPRDSLWAHLSNRYQGPQVGSCPSSVGNLTSAGQMCTNSVCVLYTQLSYTWRARTLGKDPGQSQAVTRNILQEMESIESRTLHIHPCRALRQL